MVGLSWRFFKDFKFAVPCACGSCCGGVWRRESGCLGGWVEERACWSEWRVKAIPWNSIGGLNRLVSAVPEGMQLVLVYLVAMRWEATS